MNSIELKDGILTATNEKGELVFRGEIVPGTEEWGTDLSEGSFQQNINSHQQINHVGQGGYAVGIDLSNTVFRRK